MQPRSAGQLVLSCLVVVQAGAGIAPLAWEPDDACPTEGCALSLRQLRAQRTEGQQQVPGRRQAQAEAEEDQRFWGAEWSGMKEELQQLMAAVGAADEAPPAQLSLLQAANATAARRRSPLAGIKLNLNPKSAADLVPALEMLKGFYEDGKRRVAKLNAQEKLNKERFERREADHEAKLKDIAGQKGRVSDGFLANETRDENRFWSYWQGVRGRQHQQFHTSLKIQHAALEKEKAMIRLYEEAIGGKGGGGAEADAARQLGTSPGGPLPEISLLQEAWRSTARFCGEAFARLEAASAGLGGGAEPPAEP